MISDSQIFIALLFALVSAVLAIRLGTDLYQ
uniref:Photosystem I reaction center subunit XII n=1 Tax=Gracilaria salicornia TaxID=172968 RepID=W8DWG0_9FLOR|nr:photosystem I reaction center subunit XII [Gracilaria salicornia]AHH24685.1 photosystem I reaction center subunit XII [Gracilaria salicornia]UAD87541.1 photosystem I reaction center subunit M [Gracilaria salicornia]